jgi:Protein of unknown function (DUF3048) N-terminal domain/Protein of unknown function (DUF3048) C-terminal domain
MPDDMTPGEPGDAADEPDPAATAPAGTPSVPPDEPVTGTDAEPAAGATTAPDDATSVLPTTAAADDEADTTSVLAATEAGAFGADDETTSVPSRYAPVAPDTATDESDVGPRHAKRSGMNKTWVIAIVAVVVVLAGAGIALAVTTGKKTPKALPPSIPRSTAATNIPAPSGGPVCPLTGVPAPGGQVPERPALAFKVDNYPTARPQSGLEDADVVFEEPVEGGITRFVAIFQCQSPNLVGPIRSARAIDAPILDQLSKPLFVHAGGINPVISLIENANLVNEDVFTHASIVQHPAGRYAPYDTYASAAAAWALDSGDTTPPAPLYTYSTTVPAGTPVGSVHIPFSGTNDNMWTWSPFNNAWLLSIGGVPENAADGGTRIGVANIVVQTVHITYGPWLENSEGGLEVQAQLTGSGPLAVFRNGEEITGTWQRAALGDTTSLVAANGSAIALDPGKTWVELVPSTIPVTTAPPSSSTP